MLYGQCGCHKFIDDFCKYLSCSYRYFKTSFKEWQKQTRVRYKGREFVSQDGQLILLTDHGPLSGESCSGNFHYTYYLFKFVWLNLRFKLYYKLCRNFLQKGFTDFSQYLSDKTWTNFNYNMFLNSSSFFLQCSIILEVRLDYVNS